MEKDYSHSAFKWLIYPLFSFLALILVSGIVFVSNLIPALERVTDFLFLIYLLILIFLPTIFALCGIPSVVFSFKALCNQEPKHEVLGNLLVAGIYLTAGFYFTYHLTYQVLFR